MPPAQSPPLHHPIPQHVSSVPQLRSPPPHQPPSQPQSAYGYGHQGGGVLQQQGGFGGSMYSSAFGGFVNEPTTQMGIAVGQQFMGAGQQYLEDHLKGYVSVSALKHYFNVTNSYVLTKIYIILVPWRHKPWIRSQRHNADPASAGAMLYLPPREDINSPDMYIPTMALVTYILLSTLLAGLRGAFHPELLGYTATVAISVMVLEILLIRTGTFLLAINNSSQLIDLVAYSGYKFVHVILSLLLSHMTSWIGIGGSWLSWIIFFYCFMANSFYLLRSLKYVLLPESGDQAMGQNPLAKVQKHRRTQFLFLYSYIVQLGFMLWLSRV